MARFLAKRVALAIVTLFLLSIMVFAAVQVLPGNVGRNVLGGFASRAEVAAFNRQIGADRPILVQYGSWISKLLQGHLGSSYEYRVPIAGLLGPSLVNSLKLAALAFVILVPLSILGGVVAALLRDTFVDRAITLTGISFTTVPEFVSGIVLILIFGIWLKVLPVTAASPSGANLLTQIKYLLLPAIALVMVLFGYISRIARAGTIEALDSEYTVTAFLKGLPTWTVLRRHVLRNSLLPTIAVIATQLGYLIGGLVVIEKLFNYNGIGQRIYTAATNKDLPMLEIGVLIVGVVYLTATLIADILYAILNPRIRVSRSE